MLDTIKLILAFAGGVCLIIGLIISSLGILFKLGFLLIMLWCILTVVTWKSNELSENIIALVVFTIGALMGYLYYGAKIMDKLS